MKHHILAAALLALACAASAADAPVAPALGKAASALPLGARDLPQHVAARQLAPGVAHYAITRGRENKAAYWTLLGDPAESDGAVAALQACLAKLGATPRVAVHVIGGESRRYRIVSGGNYASRPQALDAAARAGCRLAPRHTAADEDNGSGPWVIGVVAIDPAVSRARLGAVTAGKEGELRRTTTELARNAKALAAINGGFFVERDVDGYPGQPAGVSILAGKVNSAPVDLRPAVVLADGPLPKVGFVDQVDWNAWLEWSDGQRTVIDGVNRKPNLVRNCGMGDRPLHDYTCRYTDDAVYYPPGSRFAGETGGEARFAIAAGGAVRELAPWARPEASEALVVAGGVRAAQLRLQARSARATLRVQSSLLSAYGARPSVLNTGPTLIRHGAPVRADAIEGWAMYDIADPAHKLLMHDWIVRRNPRTAIGVRADGTILLVTVDGHQYGHSVGMSIEELRKLMAALGAVDAANLDGGGSTAMVLRGELVNRPSDLAGERKVGDAIVLTGAGMDADKDAPRPAEKDKPTPREAGVDDQT